MTTHHHTDRHTERRSVGELLGDLSQQTVGLVRGEIALAKAEIRQNINKMMNGAVSIAIGLVLALAALIILLEALVYGLATFMPGWLAAVIVGGVIGLIGLAMAMSGRKRLDPKTLTPDRTAHTLRDDAQLARDHARGRSPAQRERFDTDTHDGPRPNGSAGTSDGRSRASHEAPRATH
jgi:uncharacterized membrane protein YqjE